MEKHTLEIAPTGYANGLSTKLHVDENGEILPLTKEQREDIITDAANAYAQFLTALGVDWQNDPNSNNTPRRVAKAYVDDLWQGRFNPPPNITSFPSDGYTGIVFEGNIPIHSMCSHHHQSIMGMCHIAYLPGNEVVGLSKLNRIVDYLSRRGAIQEQLTTAIRHAVDIVIPGNTGVAVMIEATHNCVSCRGVRHQNAKMITSDLTGMFKTDSKVRSEFYSFVERLK